MPKPWRAPARSTIPDGVYEAESFMDDDGIDIGKRVPIRVQVIVKGDEMTVDLTDVSKQVRGFYNSGITTGYACAQVAYKCLTSPTDYPINDGSFRSLKVIVPPGRVVSAMRPAPMRWWMTYPMTIVDTIFKALQPAIPDRVIAGHHADLLAPTFHGINPKPIGVLHRHFGPLGGGWGAKHNEDGVSGTVCINDGDTHNCAERAGRGQVPDRGRALRAGRRIPAAPAATAAASASCATCARAPTSRSTPDRSRALPALGTRRRPATARATASSLRIGGAVEDRFPQRQGAGGAAQAGRRVPIQSGGGGGYGSPLERPVEHVREDVRQGYVTAKAAAELYGVIIDPVTFEVDAAATEKLRSVRRVSMHHRAAASSA